MVAPPTKKSQEGEKRRSTTVTRNVSALKKKTTVAKQVGKKGAQVKSSTRPDACEKLDETSKTTQVTKSAQKLAIGEFYAFLQCQLKMEARALMDFNVELTDPVAIKMWPAVEVLEERNQGKNEKWVPYHTVLGVHEFFVVKEIHHAKNSIWTPYRRFVAMFIFRAHCKRELFQQVQRKYLESADFWKDPAKAFKAGSPMEKEIANFRSQGNALQTSCFLIIPERILEDADANLIRNLLLRTQRIINLAENIWPVVQNDEMSSEVKFNKIAECIQNAWGFGDTWVKMLMVCIDIAMPKLKLLESRCEVGIGALGGLRQILEDEGLIAPKPLPRPRDEPRQPRDELVVGVSLGYGVVPLLQDGKQVLQVTGRMAGSFDRAHAIVSKLCEMAKNGDSIEKLIAAKMKLMADQKLEVPFLGLAEKQEQYLKQKAEDEANGVKTQSAAASSKAASEALQKLRARINGHDSDSCKHFWKLLAKVETHAQKYFKGLPLVIKQMKTAPRQMSAATLQVQLCEWRQFQAHLKRPKRKWEEAEVPSDRGSKGK